MLPRLRTKGGSNSQVMAGAAESPLHGDGQDHDSSDHDSHSPRSPLAAAIDASNTSGAFAREVAFAYLHHKHSTSPQPQQLPRAASTEPQLQSPRAMSAAGAAAAGGSSSGGGAHVTGHLMVTRRSNSEFGEWLVHPMCDTLVCGGDLAPELLRHDHGSVMALHARLPFGCRKPLAWHHTQHLDATAGRCTLASGHG
jgi:hypothetical protein